MLFRKKPGAALCMILTAAVLTSGSVSAEIHSVLVDAGTDPATGEALPGDQFGIAQVIYDVLTSRGYLVSIAGDPDTKNNLAPEAVLYLQEAGQDEAPVQSQASDSPVYADSQRLSSSIRSAYVTASKASVPEVSENSELDQEIPSAAVAPSLFHRTQEPLNLSELSDQAWVAYLLSNGIDAYFTDQSPQATAPTENVPEAPPQDAAEAEVQTTQTTEPAPAEGQEPVSEAPTQAAKSQAPAQDGQLAPSTGGGSSSSPYEAEDTSQVQAAQQKLSSVLSRVYSSFPAGNGQWGVYLYDLKYFVSGFTPQNAADPMKAASLIKLYIMGAVYENYDALSAAYGAETLNSYLRPMITVSDNDAANTLVRYLGNGDNAAGRQVVNSFCQAHGYTSTSMGRMLLEANPTGENYTSVRDCGRFLADVYRSAGSQTAAATSGSLWSNPQTNNHLEHAQEMFDLLKAQERRHKIPANMPAGVHVANKTGELDDVENDAAIIYDTANGRDLVIVFMSQGLNNVGSAQQAIAQLSRMIYDAYQE